MIRRLVAVRFISQTNTRPHRLKFSSAGYAPQTRGFAGVDDIEHGVREFVEGLPPCYGMASRSVVDVQKFANPTGGRDDLYLVTYCEHAK